MTVTEIMTQNPRTVHPTDAIGDAVDALQSLNIRHLPVVDDEGSLVGILSDRDLGPVMRALTADAEVEDSVVPLSNRCVADFMTSAVISVDLDAEIEEAVDRMLYERVGAVPVVDGDSKVVGIVSYVDVLRALEHPIGLRIAEA
ncbi:CBS domain-containing protein [Pendulispora brunnea]|uniref:CBS domain-containing protein n=1 Tax=Pendulispora brunnea TaxID=2905690 RepID=A0ABZ2K8Y0_9BACT